MAIQTIHEIGEFGLIDRIKQIVFPTTNPDVLLGIGDDTAVIKIDPDRLLLATCDIQIEDTHFRLSHITPYQLGRRAMAVNLSDIAAMGGTPTFALVSLGLPKQMPLNNFDELFKGMRDQMAEFSAIIIGGNLANMPDRMIIDIFLLGEVPSHQLIQRASARPGDRIFVTGTLGASAAGFYLLEKFGQDYPHHFSQLVQAHLQPVPKIAAGRLISESGFATAMIDVSDGLVSDLSHLCEMSQVGALIYQTRLPFVQNQQIEHLIRKPMLELALHGGEDYELLFTMKPETPANLIQEIVRQSQTPITEIGLVLAGNDGQWLVDQENNKITLQPKGWNHFF